MKTKVHIMVTGFYVAYYPNYQKNNLFNTLGYYQIPAKIITFKSVSAVLCVKC